MPNNEQDGHDLCSRELTIYQPASQLHPFLPATVKKSTCYSHSPSLFWLKGTKSGHCLPWLFSFEHQEFSDLISSSLYITSVKPLLVNWPYYKDDPVFLIFPQRHRPIMNILCFLLPQLKCPNPKVLFPLVFPGVSICPPLCLRQVRGKFCYGINQEVDSIAITQLTCSLPCPLSATAELC